MLFHAAEVRCANLHRHRLLGYRLPLPDYQEPLDRRTTEWSAAHQLSQQPLAWSETSAVAEPLPLLVMEPAYRGAA